MTLKKEDIISGVFDYTGMSKAESKRAVETLFEIMKETLENGEEVKISGFGKFQVKKKRARRGRNPRTGSDMTLRERRVLVFRTSPVLREKINSGKRAWHDQPGSPIS
ncbi:MAG: integration host factor subunit alpha [Thermodesulfobacteriota bacterium]